MTQVASLFDKRKQAKALKDAKQFTDALALYEDLWLNHAKSRNGWDGWGYAACLRKLKRVAEAEVVCRETLNAFPDVAPTRNELGWCLYDQYIKLHDEELVNNEQTFLKSAVEITNVTKQEKFSPYAKTVLKVADYLKERPGGHARDRLAWLGRLHPAELSLDPFTFVDEAGQNRVQASERERYYANLTGALHDLGEWSRCIEACDQALAVIPECHHDNDVWIKRRRALSQAKLGQVDEAVVTLKEVLAKHKAFFIQNDIAELLRLSGKPHEALVFAAQAALDRSDQEMKLKVYETLACIFEDIQQHEMAHDHYLLIAAIKHANGWRLSNDIATRLAHTRIDLSQQEFSALQRKLEQAWRLAVDAGRERVSGRIKVIRERNGHVTAERGGDYFFRLNEFRGPQSSLSVGQPVTFVIEEGFDKKKNQSALNAVDVRPTHEESR